MFNVQMNSGSILSKEKIGKLTEFIIYKLAEEKLSVEELSLIHIFPPVGRIKDGKTIGIEQIKKVVTKTGNENPGQPFLVKYPHRFLFSI